MQASPRSIWLGFDPREASAFAVARASARKHLTAPLPIRGVVLDTLRGRGLYTRPTDTLSGRWQGKDGRHWSSTEPVLWDMISQWTMATEFAISRFLVVHLAHEQRHNGKAGWALFMDCDVLVRGNLTRVFDRLDERYAVYVVKHNYVPRLTTKMDGQPQTQYSRKNWSSVCFFNCDHPANTLLTVDMVNRLPGRELHNFSWLSDDLIGGLGPECNYLVGEQNGAIDPIIVHFTNGGPWMRGYEDVPYAEEWRKALHVWAE